MRCQTEYLFYTANHKLMSGKRDMSKSLHPSRFHPDDRSSIKRTRYSSSTSQRYVYFACAQKHAGQDLMLALFVEAVRARFRGHSEEV